MLHYVAAILLQALILELPLQPESLEIKMHPEISQVVSLDEQLAAKTEKLLAVNNFNPSVEILRAELEQQIEYNFLRTLASMLVGGSVSAQEGQQEILKVKWLQLMRLTLNGELDFRPVVNKLPTLLREPESLRFNAILETIKEKNESRRQNYLRQVKSNSTTEVGKILDAVGKVQIDWKEVSTFLKEIPEVFEGVQTIVESLEDIF